jgi:hypothetical protein
MNEKKLSLVAGVCLLLAGCGQSGETVSNIPDDEPSVVAREALDAAGIAEALKKAGLPVESITILTEATDENKMMGRPGLYTSKVFFIDGRHKGEGMEPNEQNTVEVFASEEDATRRREYIEGVTKEMPMFTQYIIQSGQTLVRLDKSLTPNEAKEYEAALEKREQK